MDTCLAYLKVLLKRLSLEKLQITSTCLSLNVCYVGVKLGDIETIFVEQLILMDYLLRTKLGEQFLLLIHLLSENR